MIIRISFFVFLISMGAAGIAQENRDRATIKNLCGCFEVTFQYAEIFPTEPTYEPVKPYFARGLEWIVEEPGANQGQLVLQHLLVINDSDVIKHWREDWSFQDSQLLEYQGSHTWMKKNLSNASPTQGWTQKVYEVNDAPRYEGNARWEEQDGHPVWMSTVYSPLPRRDYSKRNDYNLLRRTNRIHVLKDKWIHEQDNVKIIRQDGEDQELVQEKGWNIYTRVEDKKCAAAKAFWENHRAFWELVRKSWARLIESGETIHLTTANQTSVFDSDFERLEKDLMKRTKKPESIQKEIYTVLSGKVKVNQGVSGALSNK